VRVESIAVDVRVAAFPRRANGAGTGNAGERVGVVDDDVR
jgi:hypothetical protein